MEEIVNITVLIFVIVAIICIIKAFKKTSIFWMVGFLWALGMAVLSATGRL